MKALRYIILALAAIVAQVAMAQRFYNLTADDVEIDSVLPSVSHNMPLEGYYSDSLYTAEILYPEFIDMTQADIAAYRRICNEQPPALPAVEQHVVHSRKKASMLFSITPIVFREGKYRFLVSFMLKVTPKAKERAERRGQRVMRAGTLNAERYVRNSLLAEGQWAKIRVPKTGFYELTADVIRRAGFTDISKVHIYGYGGNLVPEVLTDEYLREHDDLVPVESAIVDGRRLFYAKGPVSWERKNMQGRTRNPYSEYGYYFITQRDEPQDTVSKESLEQKWIESYERFYALHEVDNYAWMQGGRNLVEAAEIPSGRQYTVKINAPHNAVLSAGAQLTVSISAKSDSKFQIHLGDSLLGTGNLTMGYYDKACFASQTYRLKALSETNEIKISCTGGGPVRLDYALICAEKVGTDIDIAALACPPAEYVHNITNQNMHAHEAVDLTIIIPASQHLRDQAERLKQHHEQFDNMSVRIVPADELYNEFSSGTPDVSAYKRYMKMMYDRSEGAAHQRMHLLLLGDCVWDNRLLTGDCRSLDANNMLLCYESENSYNEIDCYVSDDFIGMLDDNEQIMSDGYSLGIPDIAIGRMPVLTVDEARSVIDKTIAYAENRNAGQWQNTIMFMGDDGDQNLHMRDLNKTADAIAMRYPGFNVRKVMWDSFKRVETATGFRYPDCTNIIKAQQKTGALIMDFCGHGEPQSISHERVLDIDDFNAFKNTNLPVWITASCNIGPFDGTTPTIGESILLNQNGGGVAFYGTTRTVYSNYNEHTNKAFLEIALQTEDGRRITLGEANRRVKEYLVTSGKDKTVNKLQYSLLGDPALALNVPVAKCVVDSINDVRVGEGAVPMLKANSKVRVKGYVGDGKNVMSDFSGLISVLVRDSREMQECLGNDPALDEIFTFYDRTKTLFSGTDSVRNGRFDITFVVPKDINYSDDNGLITMFAYTSDGQMTAHGECDEFRVGGSSVQHNDSIGPSVYCYLNSPMFVNGGNVNNTPFFVAEIKDGDGINASGAGIGHDMQLIIDNDASMTYNLNENFNYNFGTYTEGTTFCYLPHLEPGIHTLQFRVWDVLNNPSVTRLSFNVVEGLAPNIVDVNATQNPAQDATTFIVTHNRPGSEFDVMIEIFDMSGRLLHKIISPSTPGTTTCTVPWDVTIANGKRLRTGVYLYRVNISCDGSRNVSKAKKIVVTN